MLHIKAPKNKKALFKRSSFALELSSVQNIHIDLASNSRVTHSATTDSRAAGEEGGGGASTRCSLHNTTIKIVSINLRKATISLILV